MFDIGFWELLLVAVITLIVVGPDKLPGLVRTVGVWVGRIRHFANSVKTEFEDEVTRVDELKRLMEEQAEIAKRHDILQDEKKVTVPAAKPAAVAVQPEDDVAPPPSPAEDAAPKKIDAVS